MGWGQAFYREEGPVQDNLIGLPPITGVHGPLNGLRPFNTF